MNFQVSALNPDKFSDLFGLDDDALRARGAVRMQVDAHPGFPCRVSLQDANVGETVLLLNHEHLAANSPYRSRHAIFVREGVEQARPAVNELPESLRIRLLSIRAFDDHGMMVDADVARGAEADEIIRQMLAKETVSYLHIHNAKPGCYAARVDRA